VRFLGRPLLTLPLTLPSLLPPLLTVLPLKLL
jgi:hypothetical protein